MSTVSARRHQRRFGGAIRLLAAILLVLLIVATVANHPVVAPLFLLLPVFLFAAIEAVDRRLPVVKDRFEPTLYPERPALFQRPPPLFS